MKTAKELRKTALRAQADVVELVFHQIISDAEQAAERGMTTVRTGAMRCAQTRKKVSERLMALGFKVGEDHDYFTEWGARPSIVCLIVSWDHET